MVKKWLKLVYICRICRKIEMGITFLDHSVHIFDFAVWCQQLSFFGPCYQAS